jgi:glycosyltransferase involved in cell wall biosynthesis
LSRRLRVLHVGKFYPPAKGGMEIHLQQLCLGLRNQADVRVIVANEERRSLSELDHGVEIRRVGTLTRIAGASVCPGLGRQMRRANPDIVHLHLPNPTAVLSYIAGRVPGRLIVSYHSDIVRQRVLGVAFSPILHYLLRRAERIIVSTEYHIRSSRVLRRYKDKCEIIPYGVEIQPPSSAPVALLADRTMPDKPTILAVGRLVSYKGFDYLIKAMERVDGRLIVVGEGPERGRLERLIKTSRLADRAILVGAVADLAPYYALAKVFVLPSVSNNEAFGIAQAEAMARGLVVVNTSLPTAVPHVSLHGKTGLTVPPRDSAALAKAINALLADEGWRSTLGANGRQRAQQEFSIATMVSRTMQVYSDPRVARGRRESVLHGPEQVATPQP